MKRDPLRFTQGMQKIALAARRYEASHPQQRPTQYDPATGFTYRFSIPSIRVCSIDGGMIRRGFEVADDDNAGVRFCGLCIGHAIDPEQLRG